MYFVDDEKWYSSDEEDSSNTNSNKTNENVPDIIQAMRTQVRDLLEFSFTFKEICFHLLKNLK